MSLSNKQLFFIGLGLKVIAAFFFASDYLLQLFLPFISFFVESGFSNPYSHFVSLNQTSLFPYPALMLYILGTVKWVLGFLPNSVHVDIFSLRVPILIADISIFMILRTWLNTSVRRVIYLYWFSPILFYISYMHGQLDAIPVAILFTSLYLLFKDKFRTALLVLGLAVACKTHMILVFPFYVVYFIKKNVSLRHHIAAYTLFIGSVFCLHLPFVFDPAFFTMVFKNQEQGKIFNVFFSYPNALFYFIPAAYCLLLVKSISIRFYNKDIFLTFLGFSYAILLLFIPPMQGWYFWLLPFLTYFHIKDKNVSLLSFISLQLLYFLYFLLKQDSDYLQIFQLLSEQISEWPTTFNWLMTFTDAEKIKNIIFTLLQTVLFVNCVWLYQKGVASFLKHKITSQPYLIGISGDSGAGKTTLSDLLNTIFRPRNTLIIHGDDMHKWERGHQKWNEYTHLNPKANNLHKEIDYLTTLRKGDTVSRRHYDHSNGLFTNERDIHSKKIIIFEGLHAFFIKKIRTLYDLKIFIEPEKQLAQHWKVMRDMAKRKHTKEAILDQIKKREKDVKSFISSQKTHADILIEIVCKSPIKNSGDSKEVVETFIKVHFPNTSFLDTVVTALEKNETLTVRHYFDENDFQVVEVEGDISVEKIEQLADTFLSDLSEVGINNPQWVSGQQGVIQFLITYYILEHASNESVA
jgi:uridine kinase